VECCAAVQMMHDAEDDVTIGRNASWHGAQVTQSRSVLSRSLIETPANVWLPSCAHALLHAHLAVTTAVLRVLAGRARHKSLAIGWGFLAAVTHSVSFRHAAHTTPQCTLFRIWKCARPMQTDTLINSVCDPLKCCRVSEPSSTCVCRQQFEIRASPEDALR
jgi:hypothetical protein